MKRNVFIGVAWPYVNGILHIGHLAGYLIPADICARYQRLIGNNVLMASGSDCHGTPITVEADKKGLSPAEVVEMYHTNDVDLFRNILGLSYDIYTRTDTPFHAKVTQDFFIKLLEEGYIYIDSSKQFYSPAQQKFLPDRYVKGICPFCGFNDSRSDQCDNCGKLIEEKLINPKSNLTGEPVELKETQHYFLDWTKLQPKLNEYVKSAGKNWKDWVLQETNGWLIEGLKARPVSRDIDWGVEIPKDRLPRDKIIENIENKRLYVWFDAVIGYYSASLLWADENQTDWKQFWYGENLKHYYFMGKDNLVFHTLFWPGKLIIYDPVLHLPDVVSINMFLNFGKEQFSKSRGVVIEVKEMIEKYGNDRVRFYLTLIMPELRDSSFAWKDFEEKVNGILVSTIGNFVHRTLSIGNAININEITENDLTSDVEKIIINSFEKAKNHLENCEFRNYLEVIVNLCSFGNKFFDMEKIWELKKTDAEKFKYDLKQLYSLILTCGVLIMPIMPEASAKLFSMLGVETPKLWPESGNEIKEINNILMNIDTSIHPKTLFEKISLLF